MQGAIELVFVPAIGAHIRLAKLALFDMPVAEISRALAALLARFVQASCSHAAHSLMLHASLLPVYRNIPPTRFAGRAMELGTSAPLGFCTHLPSCYICRLTIL